MSYNIERGFHSQNHVLEQERMHAAQHAVREVHPDLLALTEACYGGKNSQGILMNYQDIFGFPYGCFAGYPFFGPRRGDEGGNCLLSQIPLQAEAIFLAHKGAVRGTFSLEERVLTIDVIHPSYSVEDREKIKTLQPLLSTRKNPYLLTGDFNTVHPEDQYDWNQLVIDLKSYNPGIGTAERTVSNWQKAEFISWLLGLGLRDAFPKHRRESTVPTKTVQTRMQNAQKNTSGTPSGVRLDFFFVSPEVEVGDCFVLKNQYTERASDHYPIVGIFNV